MSAHSSGTHFYLTQAQSSWCSPPSPIQRARGARVPCSFPAHVVDGWISRRRRALSTVPSVPECSTSTLTLIFRCPPGRRSRAWPRGPNTAVSNRLLVVRFRTRIAAEQTPTIHVVHSKQATTALQTSPRQRDLRGASRCVVATTSPGCGEIRTDEIQAAWRGCRVQGAGSCRVSLKGMLQECTALPRHSPTESSYHRHTAGDMKTK